MKRSLILLLICSLIVPVLFLGCEGDDGATGATGAIGPTGPEGPAGEDATAATTPESCEICHNGGVARNGETHQQAYDLLYQDGVIVVSGVNVAYNAPNQIITTFTITKTGDPTFDCTKADSLGIYFVKYTGPNTFAMGPDGRLTLVPTGTTAAPYTGSNTKVVGASGLCTVTATYNAGIADPNFATTPGLVVVYGRDETLTEEEESPELKFTRVSQNKYPFAGLLETGPAGVDYVSAANVAGCEKCHTIPFLKHGYIYGQVGGDPTTDFYTCKACHLDDGDGGHFEWQLVVDDPPRWAEIAEIVETSAANDDFGDHMTAAELTKFAYTTRLMNDVHLSHAKEFPYPQSMANCVVCHEGKLGSILTDANFVVATCKSCHPQDGSATYTGGIAGGIPYQNADTTPPGVNTTNQLALRTIMTPALHQAGQMPLDGSVVCSGCHFAGNAIGAPVFSQIHTGYDTRIYFAEGQKYSSVITVSIDNASFADNVLSFAFSAAGSAGGLSSANIVPTILVGLYGYNTKDFIVGPHESEGSPSKRLLEFSGATPPPSNNSTRMTLVSAGAGKWNATANLSDWANLIAVDNVVRVEIGVIPTLRVNPPTDNTVVALNAHSRTYNLKTNAFDDSFYPAIVKVANGCNNCHEALGRTFHQPDRGGSIVICRMCHITKAGGSHLEMQSRSIDSYAHAIHSFQAFDPGDINFTDPVLALHYDDHTRFAFPTLGRTNCESCHNTGMFNVPDQTKSFPSLSSQADIFKGRTRNIGLVPYYIMGPASRACGGCHRANFINTDDAGGLGSFNSHTRSFGYLIDEGRLESGAPQAERDAFNAKTQEDILGVIIEIFSIL